jgi:hypothetical protein
VEDAAAGGGRAAMDAALVDGLACDAGGSVHVLKSMERLFISRVVVLYEVHVTNSYVL